MRPKSVADEGKGAEFDLFDQEGHYLYKIIMPVIPKVIANGYIYSSEDD